MCWLRVWSIGYDRGLYVVPWVRVRALGGMMALYIVGSALATLPDYITALERLRAA